MQKNLLSIIIPDRNGQMYLQKTVDGLLKAAKEEIEIIVVSDGVWPNPPLLANPSVSIIHHGTQFNSPGMRESINRGIAVSHGEFIMKLDEHCLMDEGFDVKLKSDYEEETVVIPRRYRLDGDEWKRTDEMGDKRPPVDYMYLEYPYAKPFDKTQGLHGAKDEQRAIDRADILIDDVMTGQGSCHFTKREYWDKILPNGMRSDLYGNFTQEAQEISNNVWRAGGRMRVNKKTWYAHMHKGKKGKGYGFNNEQYFKHSEMAEKGRLYCINYWVFEQRAFFKTLLEKFWPVPGWPEDWEIRIEQDKLTDYSTLKYKDDFWLKGLRQE
jgi:glycosyltransferase involved in cell wall biosynthesis